MKKVYVSIIAMMAFVAVNAQNQQAPAAATPTVQAQQPDNLVLKETEHNFGKIPQGKPVTHEFEIQNVGKEPLALENVQASCGCTTPTWSKEPIAPGKTAKIAVGYNAAAAGHFEKWITISYAGGKVKQYKISGEVWTTPAQPAPANNNGAAIKNN